LRLVRAAAELVVLNVALTFAVSNVDWAAHIGGVVAGSVLGRFSSLSPAAKSALAAPRAPDGGVIATAGTSLPT
jgi:membrane associated rhomboid family serine protease